MGLKLLATAIAVFLISPVLKIPAGEIVAAVLALIGIVLLWMDK